MMMIYRNAERKRPEYSRHRGAFMTTEKRANMLLLPKETLARSM